MDLGTAAATFALVFPAELPDKTFVSALVLSTRLRPAAVWVGAAGAFAVQCAVAVTAGGVISLLPERPVRAVAALLFAVGAVVLWRTSSHDDDGGEEEAEEELARATQKPHRAAVTAFVVMFVAEWGDLTQILTATLAARYNDPWSVFVGSLLALWAVAGLAVVAGRFLRERIPLALVQRLAAALFALLAVLAALEAIRG